LRSTLLLGVLAVLLSSTAHADEDQNYENWLLRVGDYETLYRGWWWRAGSGDAAMQERVAAFALGPHAREAKAQPLDGIHFLFRAALNGRPTAMRRLASALDEGTLGLARRPDAARCWRRAPAGFEARLACVKLTTYRDPVAHLPCGELAAWNELGRPAARDGAAIAQLCLANRTPAILVFGLPPGPREVERQKAYARHGIEWIVTGDVYTQAFEKFRVSFNDTMVAALDAERGAGYMDKLAQRIEAGLAPK